MRITFEVVKARGQRTIIVDGKKKRQQKTFEQTVNPFNKNPDGTIKTYEQVLESVNAVRDAWVEEARTN